MGVQRSRQLRRVIAVGNIGYLRGRESHNLEFGIVAENYVEVMKVPAGGT